MAKIIFRNNTVKSNLKLIATLVVLGLMTACSKATTTTSTSPELAALLDRAAIEALISDYYSQFEPNAKHDFVSFFTADGRLEVNGLIAENPDEIRALYVQAGVGGDEEATEVEGAVPGGVSEMMFSNLKIELQGNSAVLTLLWYSIDSDLLTSPPKVTEYGRERTELVKQDGRWLISRRVILSEGGMPEGELASYPKR
jgi:hypothetical protein